MSRKTRHRALHHPSSSCDSVVLPSTAGLSGSLWSWLLFSSTVGIVIIVVVVVVVVIVVVAAFVVLVPCPCTLVLVCAVAAALCFVVVIVLSLPCIIVWSKGC